LAECFRLLIFLCFADEICFGLDISPGGAHPERKSFSDVVFLDRLRLALLNPVLRPSLRLPNLACCLYIL
jgi:hypothetical protein